MSGFVHSVKVPTQYKALAKILKTALEKKRSVKTLVFEERHARQPNLLAVLQAYSDNREAIDDAIETTGLLRDNPRLQAELCKVLVTELIYGRKELKGESKPVQVLRGYEERLKEALGDAVNNTKGRKAKPTVPRYVRVNENTYSIREFLAYLAAEGWNKRELPSSNAYADFLSAIDTLDADSFMPDINVEGLFIFHAKNAAYWAGHEFVQDKRLVLQDKATSLAAVLLAPKPGSVVLDMCAAPGNKTLHLSNVMNNQGLIYAVEQDVRRYQELCRMVEKSGSSIITPINGDALQFVGEDFPDVEYILLDPTCSGSGIRSRISVTNDEKDERRLHQLSGLQIKLLMHAMSDYPNVKRIVYCTCSLYEEENEEVIRRVLNCRPQFKLLNGKKALRGLWQNTGSTKFEGVGKHCLYARPELDKTTGIFLALFERRNLLDE